MAGRIQKRNRIRCSTVQEVKKRKKILLLLTLMVLLVTGWLGYQGYQGYRHLEPEYSPAVRGLRVAERAGCFTCHARVIEQDIINPLKRTGTAAPEPDLVPSFIESRYSPETIREWIVRGITEEEERSERFLARRAKHLLRMPAYGSSLSSEEVDDLLAYIMLAQYAYAPKEQDERSDGEKLARAYGCFGCHGMLGQGGVSNPLSLKDYIPGFFGRDFDELTQHGDRAEVQAWIRDGASLRFLEQNVLGWKAARYYTERQVIPMPAFKDFLTDQELDTLVDYVLELRQGGPLTYEDLRE